MQNLHSNIEKVLIIGATGKTGRRVCQLLSELLPSDKIKAASRSAEIHFDWQDNKTWSKALDQTSHVYLTYSPDLAVPSAIQHISTFCNLAKKKNIKHITILSGRGEPAAQACEDILINSGINWTIIRASWFNQNFSDGFFNSFIHNGLICLPVNAVKEPFIDIDDIAEIACQSFIDPKHSNKLYEVTGPELLTFSDIAKLFSEVLNKEVKFEQLTQATFESEMSAAQVPEDIISLLNFLFTEVLDGRNEYITNGVEQALGRKPKSFRAFIKANIDKF
ncbi:NmrA family NAD(P)-binding protein [Thalassotalea agariperforans]